MLRYIVGVSLVTAVITFLRLITDKKIARKYQYAMWLAVPIFMLLFPVPSVKVTLPKLPEVQVIQETPVAASDLELQLAEEVRPLENKATAPAKRSINWEVMLRDISLSVSAVILGSLTVYNIGFVIYCIRRRTYLMRDSDSGLKVYRIDNETAPFLLGRNIYVNGNDEGPLKYVLCHEACHYRHKDMYWIVLRYIVLALNWYNPLIWMAFIQSGRDCELACDEEVLRRLGRAEATEYGRMLLNLISNRASVLQSFSMTTGMRGTFKMMRRRITSIKHPIRNSKAALAICIVLVILITGCSLIEYNQAEESLEYQTDIMDPEYAKEFALHMTTIDEEDVTFTRAELVDYDGRAVYEVEFLANGNGQLQYEYEFDFDAHSGEVINRRLDTVGHNTRSEENEETSTTLATPDIGYLPDGQYTVVMTADCVTSNNGVPTYQIIPWSEYEIGQDYIDSLTVGDEYIFPEDAAGLEVEPGTLNSTINNIKTNQAEPRRRYTTEYTGEYITVNDDSGVNFRQTADGRWILFLYDEPVIRLSEPIRLQADNRPDIFDAYHLVAFGAADALTDEERMDALQFRDGLHTTGITNNIEAFFEDTVIQNNGFYYIDGETLCYSHTVITVENNTITQVFFWA
ncbi:MAG: PepSY domain-containing protein [Clostridiales bacterium]|nr:PepSY domain-containing protein [Clostridiales bacterium]